MALNRLLWRKSLHPRKGGFVRKWHSLRDLYLPNASSRHSVSVPKYNVAVKNARCLSLRAAGGAGWWTAPLKRVQQGLRPRSGRATELLDALEELAESWRKITPHAANSTACHKLHHAIFVVCKWYSNLNPVSFSVLCNWMSVCPWLKNDLKYM